MTKKQIVKAELPNEVDILRSTLADVKVKLPGLDAFLLANPDCTRCSNSKAYQCVQLKGKPGCRTCSSRRISCTRHVQYLVEMTASRLEWSVEKTRSMYDKHVKQTRSGKKSLSSSSSVSKVKKVTRKAVAAPRTVGSSSTTANQTGVDGKGGRRRNEPYYLDWSDDAEDDLEEDDEDDAEDIEWENTTKNTPHTNSNATFRTPSSKPKLPSSSDSEQVEIPTFIRLGDEEAASLDQGLHDEPSSLRTESEKTDTAPRVDLTQLQLEKERKESVSVVSRGHTPESSMSAEQRIKQLEEKVAELNALRLVDAASISRLEKRADTAFDNMSVLLSHVRLYRQELGSIITKHIETAHQKQQFKPLIDKMDETSVSATHILMLLDNKRKKNYEMPQSDESESSSPKTNDTNNKTRVQVVITDEEGEEWVPWDVISDDNNNNNTETSEMMKRRRDDNNGPDDDDDDGSEGSSSKRRKC